MVKLPLKLLNRKREMKMSREARITRTTKETDVKVTLYLDGTGKADIYTGIGFFDHMLTALTVHGGFDLDRKSVV